MAPRFAVCLNRRQTGSRVTSLRRPGKHAAADVGAWHPAYRPSAQSMCSGSETDPGPSCRPPANTEARSRRFGRVMTTGAVYEGATGLRTFREMSAETCVISVRDDPRSFHAQCRVYHLGSAVLAELRSNSIRYRRSARHVARGAYDHYQIVFNLSGRIHYRAGRRSAVVRPDDIIILDSARETDAYVHAPDQGSAHALTLFVARAALAALRREAGGGHLLLLSRETTLARSAHDHLWRMLQAIEAGPQARAQAATQALIGVLAGSLGRRRHLPPTLRRAAPRSAVDSVERLIERRLDSPALSLELLCSHCGCSRATLYRLLQAEGGPIRYIRQRRMQRAFQELISGSVSQGRLLELALRHRFASQATFNRAFRRTFGIPPGEVRAIATRSRRAVLVAGTPVVRTGREAGRAIDWIRALTEKRPKPPDSVWEIEACSREEGGICRVSQ
jgi:AraC-like DNA-binding protein